MIYEDNLFSVQVALKAKRAGYIKKTLFNRRVRSESTTGLNTSFKKTMGHFLCYVYMMDFIRDEKFDTHTLKSIETLLNEYIWRARTGYCELDFKQREEYKKMPFYLQKMFQELVVNSHSVQDYDAIS